MIYIDFTVMRVFSSCVGRGSIGTVSNDRLVLAVSYYLRMKFFRYITISSRTNMCSHREYV